MSMVLLLFLFFFFFSSRRRHTRLVSDWSSDVCSSDLWRRAAASGRHAPLSDAEAPDAQRPPTLGNLVTTRSEERRVGKECRSRWWPEQEQTTKTERIDHQSNHSSVTQT